MLCSALGLTSALRRIRAHLRTTGSNASRLLLAWKTKHKFQMYSLRWYRPPSPVSAHGNPMIRYSCGSSSSVPRESSVTSLPCRLFFGMT